MKKILILIFLVLLPQIFAKENTHSQKMNNVCDISLSEEDILVLPEDSHHMVDDGRGAHLFVRKKNDIESISLLIENDNYNDPDLSLMRAKKFNSINGNEIRLVYGKIRNRMMEKTPNALISSTTETIFFGECFHIYIPKEMYYGYVIETQDECEFRNGMTVSIRTFEKKHCDIGGNTLDNIMPLVLSDWETEESFYKISSKTGGTVFHAKSPSELQEKLYENIDSLDKSAKIDIVFAIDATESMKDDFSELRNNWHPKFEKQAKQLSDARIGLLFYKDYGDEFNFKNLPVKNMGFLKTVGSFSRAMKNISVKGGGDYEEAVCEAIYACTIGFDWRSDSKKKIILIGDAPPHKSEKLEFKSIYSILNRKEISVDCFLISGKAENMRSIKKNAISDSLSESVEKLTAK